MGGQILIVVILAALSLSVSEQIPCSENKCSNLTLYLGPRLGSKLIQFPNYQKIKGPNEKEFDQQFDKSNILTKTLSEEQNDLNFNDHDKIIYSQHRPVPEDNSFHIDYRDQSQHLNSSNRLKIGNITELFVDHTLNLRGLGIKEKDLKDILSSLTDDLRLGVQELYLNNNPLEYLHDETLLELSRMTNLKVLNVSGTSLRGVAYFKHPTLEVLDLSYNLITLPQNCFVLPNLLVLNLSNNRIITLLTSFTKLPNLKVLSLDNNDLDYMFNNALKYLRLQELHLRNNKFHMIYQILVNQATSPNVSLYLSGNPLSCNCFAQEDLMNRGWPHVADWDQLMCREDLKHELRLVSEVAKECQSFMGYVKQIPNRWGRGWNKLYFFLRGLGISSPDDFIIYSALLIAILLVWLAFRRRRLEIKDKTMPADKSTPYTILNSKEVP